MYKYVLLHNNSSRNLVVCKKHRYQIVNCGVTELPYNLSNLFLKFETLGLFPKTASKDNFGYHFILYREKITRIKSIHLNKLLNSLKLKFISFYKNTDTVYTLTIPSFDDKDSRNFIGLIDIFGIVSDIQLMVSLIENVIKEKG